MSGAVTTNWTGPDELLRGEDYVASLTTTQDGAALDIDSATVSLVKPDGTVAATAAATCVANVATYTFDGVLTASEDPGEGWRITWALVLDGTPAAAKLQNPAAVVLYQVAPTVTPDSLLKRESEFRNKLAAGGLDDILAECIGEAWIVLTQRLRQKGRRPYLVLDSYALHESLTLLSASYAYRRVATEAGESVEWAKATLYEDKFETAWGDLTFEEADPSTWQSTGVRKGASPTMWLGSGTGTGTFRRMSPGFGGQR